MQGIEVLNKEPIMRYTKAGVIIGIIALILVIVGFIGAKISEEIYNDISTIIFLIMIIVGGIALFVNGFKNQKPTGRYQYEAVIQNDVSINEVYKNYDVIEKKGKKWILEDKE